MTIVFLARVVLGMPGPPLCAKCRQIGASEGDSWCTGCTAWEFVGRELTASWDSVGARALASDIILSAGRQIRALRSLSAGLAREERRAPDPEEKAGSERSTLPRRRSLAPPPPAPKEEDLSCDEEESEEESERRDPTPEVAPIRGSHQPPPEPDGPPPDYHRRHRGAGTSRASHKSSSHREHSDRRDSQRHSGKRRGGRKHQRLYRLATDPSKVVHRKPGQSFWELRSSDLSQLELDRLGR